MMTTIRTSIDAWQQRYDGALEAGAHLAGHAVRVVDAHLHLQRAHVVGAVREAAAAAGAHWRLQHRLGLAHRQRAAAPVPVLVLNTEARIRITLMPSS